MIFAKWALALSSSAIALSAPLAAFAQTSTPDPRPPAQATPATQAASNPASDMDKAIIVTGSRVITNGNKSPTPVTVVPTEQLLRVQPTTVVDAVNLAPALQGSQSLSSPPGGGQRNGAAAYFNLRSLGDLRTLVLMDGNRVVPTINAFGANTDAFVIPQMLIQRVDVVTGGVSAVYGSDAVSGVVNFITDRSFQGLKVQGSMGISKYGDDPQTDLGVAYGRKFSDGRGHFEMSYEYRYDGGINGQTSRPFTAASIGGAGSGTAASPYYNVTNTRISSTSFGGLINSGPLAGYQFAQNGTLTKFNPGTPTGTAGVASGGDGGWYNTASLKSALRFHQVFGRVDYDVTDSIHAYLQGSGTFNHTSSAYRAALENITLSNSNPFVQQVPQLAAAAAANPNGTFSFSKLYQVPPTADQYTNTYMVHGGVDGKLGKYKWNVNFGQSMSQITAYTNNNFDQNKYAAATNVVTSPTTGQPVCAASLTNAAFANCVPLNPFGPSSESQAALNYVITRTWNRNRTTLSEANADISGAPFDTWAGPVNMALSAEWRRIGWSVTGNASPADPVDCRGIQYNCTITTTRWQSTTQPPLAKVHQDVKEVAYEVDLPLAADVPWAKSLDLNGAVRYTDYSTSGSVWTWKGGIVWRPNDELTLRGTASRDIRAPSVYELFGPRTVAVVNLNDPYTKSTGSVPVATISNPNLTPEKAKSFTGGFVWSPHFIPHFSLTVDGYYININNAITQINGNSSAVENLCAAAQGNSPACSVITRPAGWTSTASSNFPTQLYNQYLNIASYKTYGVDFEGNYSPRIFDKLFNLRALMSWQPHMEFNQGPAGIIQLAGAATGLNPFFGIPKFKYTVIASYDITPHVNLTWMQRGRGTMHVSALVNGQTAPVFANGKSDDPGTTYSNVTVTFKIDHPGHSELYFNVQNLFNKQPDLYFAGADASPGLGQLGFFPPSGDDLIGRYFTIGFRSKF